MTAVAAFRQCKLKLVTSTKEWRPHRLPTGPEAAIGELAHRVLEAAARSTETPEAVFDLERSALEDALRRDPARAHFADLAKTRSSMDWRNFKAETIARCRRSVRRSPPVAELPSTRSGVVGDEVSLADPSLRIRGRLDRVERTGTDSYAVSDFKSGRILGSDGSVLPAIQLQLRLYALLVDSATRGARVELRVDSTAGSYEIPWNERIRDSTLEELARIVSGPAPGSVADAASMANPSSECALCGLRHRCRSYLHSATTWWNEIPHDMDVIPADTWGHVIQIEATSSKVSLALDDAAGRRVKIRGLRPRSDFGSMSHGSRIFLFGLEQTGTGRGWNGRPFHPHAFHEESDDPKGRTAWTTAVFGAV